MPATKPIWTREAVLALPDDGNRYELVDGELLVSPSPRYQHQAAVAGLFRLLDAHVRQHRLGEVLFAPADLTLDSGQFVQPDLFVARLIEGRSPRGWPEIHIPSLIVEVLSPRTAEYDRETKRLLFQRVGVPDYWIVDADARNVECWRPGASHPLTCRNSLIWQPDESVPALEIDLPAYFREVWGEDVRRET